jgi:hypothetical protein
MLCAVPCRAVLLASRTPGGVLQPEASQDAGHHELWHGEGFFRVLTLLWGVQALSLTLPTASYTVKGMKVVYLEGTFVVEPCLLCVWLAPPMVGLAGIVVCNRLNKGLLASLVCCCLLCVLLAPPMMTQTPCMRFRPQSANKSLRISEVDV